MAGQKDLTTAFESFWVRGVFSIFKEMTNYELKAINKNSNQQFLYRIKSHVPLTSTSIEEYMYKTKWRLRLKMISEISKINYQIMCEQYLKTFFGCFGQSAQRRPFYYVVLIIVQNEEQNVEIDV